MRDFLLCKSTSSVDIWGRKTYTFDPGLGAGRHTFNVGPYLLLEIYIRTRRRKLLLFAFFLAHPFLPWHWNLLLCDSSIYRRHPTLCEWGTIKFLVFLFTDDHCWINLTINSMYLCMCVWLGVCACARVCIYVCVKRERKR